MTNVLLFKKIKKINGMMDVYRDEIKEAPEKPDLPKIN